jgi:ferredoxin
MVEVRNRGARAVTVPDDGPILDALEGASLYLPYGCRYGACITCAAWLVSGTVDHSYGRACALRPEQLQRGYILPCIARARSDCVIEAGPRPELYCNPFRDGMTGRVT